MSDDVVTRDDGLTELTVTIPPAEVEKALDAAYRKLVRGATIPGFRKGRAPRSIFERYVGTPALYEEALPEILPQAFEKAAVEAGIDPMGQPEYDVKDLGSDGPLVFTVAFRTRPLADPGDYKSISVPFEEPEVASEEVDEQIDAIRERLAQMVPVDDESVKVGPEHAVVMDMTFTLEGGESQESQEIMADMGRGDVLPEFRDNILGHTAGSIVEFTLTFPDDHPDMEMAGKEGRFRVLIKEIKTKLLPELDDDFAQEHSGDDTVMEMRESIRERIHQSKHLNAFRDFEIEVKKALVEGATIEDLPDSMIEQETVDLARNLGDISGMEDLQRQRILESLRQAGESRAREKLVLEGVSRAENLKIDPDEWSEKVQGILEVLDPGQRDSARERLSSGFARRSLERDILRNKAMILVSESASEEYAAARKAVMDETEDPSTPEEGGELE